MINKTKEKRIKTVPILISILTFLLAFFAGALSKFIIKPSWAKNYSVEWNDKIGTLKRIFPMEVEMQINLIFTFLMMILKKVMAL